MHLSRIDVREGQQVIKGASWSERSNGPSNWPASGWGGRLEDAYLDPAKLLKLDLSAAGVSS